MNRIDRISAILIQLQSKRIVKAQEIADRFEISVRTVYRDMRSLQETGIPIISEAGTGYSLADGYRLPPVMFTTEEVTTFLMAEKLLEKLSDQETYAKYRSALFKIKAILKYSEKDQLEAFDQNIKVLNSGSWQEEQANSGFTQIVLQSIAQKLVVSIDYIAAYNQSRSERKIEPIGIYFSTGNWYVIGFCWTRNDYRNFRMDRIVKATMTNLPFEKKHPSLETYLNQLTKEEKELHPIVIKIEKKASGYLSYQKYYMGFVDEVVEEEHVIMTFLSASIEGFARWFMMFGDSAEIVKSDLLKKTVKEQVSKILQKIHDVKEEEHLL